MTAGGFNPAQGGFAQQGGFPAQNQPFPAQGGFAQQQYQNGGAPASTEQYEEIVVDDSFGSTFAPTPKVEYLKWAEYASDNRAQAHIAIMRFNGIRNTPRQNQPNAQTLDLDVCFINQQTQQYEVHEGVTNINSYIIGMARRLLAQKYRMTAGILTYGEKKGGHQAPLILDEISDPGWSQYAQAVAAQIGWIPGAEQDQQATQQDPAQQQAPAPAQQSAAPAPQQAQAPAPGQAPAPAPGTNPLGG